MPPIPAHDSGSWKLEAGNWKMETGGQAPICPSFQFPISSFQCEDGSWKLENGNWKLEAGIY
jgi:hypothetical protein